ncbi:MAG TPA: trehalose-phosphatase [Rhodocyclaceae bacterium]|nr:trehalose-phosphatase [Rhodocyclaceae bacterium]
MKYFFSREGECALDDILARRPLFAFDFDGTLAPIMVQRDAVHTTTAIAQGIDLLAEIYPVVIITGRSIADVSERLGFKPRCIIGNHGAEGLVNRNENEYLRQVAEWQSLIEASYGEALRNAGVMLENKHHSLSLHYRLAHDESAAQELIAQVTALATPTARVFGGKCVVNIVPADAPDKAEALFSVVRSENTDSAFFVGDDQNDESIFQRCPAHWLTVRVGRHHESLARYYLDDQSEMIRLVELILARLKK